MPQEIGSTPSRQHDFKAGQLTGKQHHVDAQRFAQNSPHASLRRMVVSLIFDLGSGTNPEVISFYLADFQFG